MATSAILPNPDIPEIRSIFEKAELCRWSAKRLPHRVVGMRLPENGLTNDIRRVLGLHGSQK